MKVVKIGQQYQIYNDTIETFDVIPPKTYTIRFAKMSGFFLEAHTNLTVQEKVYGPHVEKAEKVLRSFKIMERNLGVILSGDKGIGKSMFSRLLCDMAVAAGYPVLIADNYYPGIDDYLESIQQEIVVLFDEFDKTFAGLKAGENEADAQSKLLSLFDGLSMGKKLFVITCNNINRLSDYLVNRPGRFHYHFRFAYPNSHEIEVYLKDHLDEKYYGEINQVTAFAGKVNLNYDCLRAIAFELNLGVPFKEAIKDLNILDTGDTSYSLVLRMKNGMQLINKNYGLRMFGDETESVWLSSPRCADIARVDFSPRDAVYDEKTGSYHLEAGMFQFYLDEHEDPVAVKEIKETEPLYLQILKSADRSLHYVI